MAASAPPPTTIHSAGLERAIRVSKRDWWSDGAYRAINLLVEAGQLFTTEDVVAMIGEPHEPHLMGAVIAGARRSGQIESVSAVLGKDGRPRRVWGAAAKGVSAGAEQARMAEDAPRSA